MSDDGERTCPLCAEEMDLTDQQLKPCKCGYEICVWCWHHIMDMAEKEETEGRCPACRTPYDKERIVGMAANCERVVAEINAEKKQKSQKAKPKASTEARKHLSSVRVIQRNLVYIIGLPSNLCDESILERREYFGQYGKVLKVSISRPSSAAAQQASNNNTFSVYITYAREEEAVRCIQAVHNFVLEGKSLRACFGTTKYCHAWLRNMTCSNPDCLYLHDIGSQEDSFTKDEIISAYTRSRVPQIASNNSQRRSGNVLPPPADDFSSSGTVTGKQAVKSVSNNAPSPAKGSPPNSSGKPTILPAAASWGLRSSSCRTLAVSAACSQTPVKQKVETLNSTTLLSSMTASTKQSSAWHDDVVTTSKMPERRCIMPMNGISKPSEPSKPSTGMDCQTVMSSEALTDADCFSVPSAWNDDVIIISKTSEPFISANGKECWTSGSDLSPDDALDTSRTFQDSVSCLSRLLAPEAEDKGRDINLAGANTKSMNHLSKSVDRQSSSADEAAKGGVTVNGNIEGLCLDLSSVSIDNHPGLGQSSMDQHQTSKSNLSSRPQQGQPEQMVEHLSSEALSRASSLPETHFSNELLEWDLEPRKQGFMSTGIEREDDVNNRPSCSPYLNPPKSANQSSYSSWNNGVGIKHPLYAGDSKSVETKVDVSSFVLRENESALCNGHKEDEPSSLSNSGKVFESPEMNCSEERLKCLGKTDAVANSDKTSLDMGESSIISDILSLDFDPWDDSSSANNFARLLGETDKQHGSFKLSSSWKSQNSNQSRFSFARQESQASSLEASLRDSGNAQKLCSSLQDAFGDGFQSGLQFNNFEGPYAVFNSNPVASCDRLVGVSRAKISAPPGFSSPSRAPPPGFSSQDRLSQAYDTTYSDNHLLSSPSLGNQYQAHLTGNPDDVEFIDPAILAVGKGRMPLGINNSVLSSKSALPSQFSTSNSDPRLQLLMQQSISSHQNLRIPDHVGDRYLPLNDTYMTSRLLAQNHGSLSPFTQLSLQQPRSTQISVGQWSGWNDVRTGSEMSMPDILRNERFGINNFYSGNEEHKFHIPSSADLYNRAFGL